MRSIKINYTFRAVLDYTNIIRDNFFNFYNSDLSLKKKNVYIRQ